jgi:hypothetical protein
LVTSSEACHSTASCVPLEKRVIQTFKLKRVKEKGTVKTSLLKAMEAHRVAIG